MKICFLHHTYPGIGGTETVTNLLAKQFISKGHEVSVLSWCRPVSTIESNLDVDYLPDIESLNSAENNNYIYNYLKNKDVDCIINQGPFWIPSKNIDDMRCIILSVLHYAPSFKIENQKNAIIEKFKEKSPDCLNTIKSSVRYLFKNYFARRDFQNIYKDELNRIVVNSDGFVMLCPEYVSEFQSLMKKNYTNLYAIENGLPIPAELKIREKEKTVVCVGRLTKWDKRIDRLLYIWSSIQNDFPEWKLQILGDGPERDNLQKLAVSLGLMNYEFLGFVNINDYLPQASILAMTSSSEGFPMVILEGFSHGVVPIAYEVSGGISHLIENDETGYLVRPFNRNEYVWRLKMLMSSRSTLSRISALAREKVKMYEMNRIADCWIELIESLRSKK